MNSWKLGSGLKLLMREQRDSNRRGFDTKVAKSERDFSFPVRLIEKCCWVTAPHAGVKIKACGSTLFCGCGSFGRAPHPRPTRERGVGGGVGGVGGSFGGDGGPGVMLRSLAEVFTECNVCMRNTEDTGRATLKVRRAKQQKHCHLFSVFSKKNPTFFK